MKKQLLLLLFAFIVPQFIQTMEEPSYSWFGSKPKKPEDDATALRKAIDKSDIDAINSLINKNHTLLETFLDIPLDPGAKAHPLAYAIFHRKKAAAQELINQGALPGTYFTKKIKDASGEDIILKTTALYIAIENGFFDIASSLLEQYNKKNISNPMVYEKRSKNEVIKQKTFKEVLKSQEKSIKKVLATITKYEEAEEKRLLASAQIAELPGLRDAIIGGRPKQVETILTKNKGLLNLPIPVDSIENSKVKKRLRVEVYTAIPNYVKKKLGGYSYRSETGRIRTGLNALRNIQPYFTDYGSFFVRGKLGIAHKPHFWQQTMTPLYFALFMGQEEIVKTLLAKGADPLKGYVLDFSTNLASIGNPERDYYIKITQTPLYFIAKNPLISKDIDSALIEAIKKKSEKEKLLDNLNQGYELDLTLRVDHQKIPKESIFQFKQSPLKIAVKKGSEFAIKLLEAEGIIKGKRIKFYPAEGEREMKRTRPLEQLTD